MTPRSGSLSGRREKRKRERLTEGMVAALIERIVSGDFRPGDMLPPEAILGAEFDVSRTVVREAIKTLEAKGLVSVQQGRGSVVMPRSSSTTRAVVSSRT
jgi:GntR family galactonate operon transcriptional repressor